MITWISDANTVYSSMIIAVSHMRPDELPGLLTRILTEPVITTGQLVDITKYLSPCGKVQMRLGSELHLLPLPATVAADKARAQ